MRESFLSQARRRGEDDAHGDVAQHGGVEPCAGAGERRGGGEDGAGLVSGHQHVADVALAAGRAHLSTKM